RIARCAWTFPPAAPRQTDRSRMSWKLPDVTVQPHGAALGTTLSTEQSRVASLGSGSFAPLLPSDFVLLIPWSDASRHALGGWALKLSHDLARAARNCWDSRRK